MMLIANGQFGPTDGAIVPELLNAGKEKAAEAFNAWLLEKLHTCGDWLATSGLPMIAEFVMLWGLICLVMGITGSGKWMERGVKSVLISIFLGLVRYAV